jgi:colicin import membrane protein
MAVRNAYIASGILHLAVIGLVLMLAQMPLSPRVPVLRYQPVRLVAAAKKPGPVTAEPEKPKPSAQKKPKPKPQEKVKTEPAKKEPAVKSTAKSQEKPAETAAESKSGGGLENVNLDGVHFPYPYYLSNIQIKILSNFKPVINRRDVQGLKAVVYFLIDRNGKISGVKLERKSGHFLFDQEAQRAVMRSNPLPALPPAFSTDQLGVHFEFVASD